MIRIERREPATVTHEAGGLAVIETAPIGFAGAAEDERRRWLTGFRRLIDALDSPLQAVIEVTPGPDDESSADTSAPKSSDVMRARDLDFVGPASVNPYW